MILYENLQHLPSVPIIGRFKEMSDQKEINKERVGPIPRGNRINYIPKIKYIKYSTSGFFQLRRKTLLSNSKSLCVLCIVSVRLLQIQKQRKEKRLIQLLNVKANAIMQKQKSTGIMWLQDIRKFKYRVSICLSSHFVISTPL